ncbi:hypothetical protein PR048_012917 [Dryococelus australis]|uniref:Polyprotein n=1 Tax=Dryococelus australis TaxID=614101 RepID=A0ABQ9HRE1_9NEOP|nr:hypothetical protein PR048_012917 [Dryococelus australis]
MVGNAYNGYRHFDMDQKKIVVPRYVRFLEVGNVMPVTPAHVKDETFEEVDTPKQDVQELAEWNSEGEDTKSPGQDITPSGKGSKDSEVLSPPNGSTRKSARYGSDGAIVDAFVDTDFANDPQDRKSVRGFFIRVFGNYVTWKIKKPPWQPISKVQFVLFKDNQSCIKMASTFETKCSKHVSVKNHFVKDLVQNKVLKLVYVDTHNQVADVLTKALPSSKFQVCVTGLGIKKWGGRDAEKGNFYV